ncbi:hypothetical protein SEA_CLOWN_85 [Gordonia phage Clown]|uniref:Uncharacterized protein n=1 Tax=Gordonia phage Clown TaxID=2759393 RepID=A0A7L7SI23_9CAUD|nr:hypothetical protein KNV25_gp85 [Gordonia phage Clown]QOC56083.1 hypothetical protein SEA_CLOWN_85 [Gordonia phage Clown]
MTQTPSIGRIVHYQSYGTPGGEYLPEPRAAIITEVQRVVDGDKLDEMYPTAVERDRALTWYDDGPRREDGGEIPMTWQVGLAVLNPTGMFFNQLVPYAETPTPGHWNWPPRTDSTTITVNTQADPADVERSLDREKRRRMRRYIK